MSIDRSKYLSPRQVGILRASCAELLERGRQSDTIACLVVEAALGLGLRVNELARLTLGDFDLHEHSVRVYRSKRGKPHYETIPVPDRLLKALRRHLSWRVTVGQETHSTAPLFIGERGPMSVRGLQKAWERMVAAAGLPKLSIHGARHTFATSMRRETGDIRLTQVAVGHRSLSTTVKYYDHVSFEELQAALNKAVG